MGSMGSFNQAITNKPKKSITSREIQAKEETQNKQIVPIQNEKELSSAIENLGNQFVLRKNLNYWKSEKRRGPKSSSEHIPLPAIWKTGECDSIDNANAFTTCSPEEKFEQIKNPPKFSEESVPLGTVFHNRVSLVQSGVHCNYQQSIHSRKLEIQSILIDGFNDGDDSFDFVWFQAPGGRAPGKRKDEVKQKKETQKAKKSSKDKMNDSNNKPNELNPPSSNSQDAKKAIGIYHKEARSHNLESTMIRALRAHLENKKPFRLIRGRNLKTMAEKKNTDTNTTQKRSEETTPWWERENSSSFELAESPFAVRSICSNNSCSKCGKENSDKECKKCPNKTMYRYDGLYQIVEERFRTTQQNFKWVYFLLRRVDQTILYQQLISRVRCYSGKGRSCYGENDIQIPESIVFHGGVCRVCFDWAFPDSHANPCTQSTLSSAPITKFKLISNTSDSIIAFNKSGLDFSTAECYLKDLMDHVKWQQSSLGLYKEAKLTAFFGEPGVKYGYGGNIRSAEGWKLENEKEFQKKGTLEILSHQVEEIVREECSDLLPIKNFPRNKRMFNCVLLNYYISGKNYMNWHADDEANLGVQPIIVSVSLGEKRTFSFKRSIEPDKDKTIKPKFDLELTHGTILVMAGWTQLMYRHTLKKNLKKCMGPRINLTFRLAFNSPQEEREIMDKIVIFPKSFLSPFVSYLNDVEPQPQLLIGYTSSITPTADAPQKPELFRVYNNDNNNNDNKNNNSNINNNINNSNDNDNNNNSSKKNRKNNNNHKKAENTDRKRKKSKNNSSNNNENIEPNQNKGDLPKGSKKKMRIA